MGLLNGLVKAGIAQKVIEQARKPQNQAKAKQLIASLQSRSAGRKRP